MLISFTKKDDKPKEKRYTDRPNCECRGGFSYGDIWGCISGLLQKGEQILGGKKRKINEESVKVCL